MKFAIFLLASLSFAQVNSGIRYVSTTPSGSCSANAQLRLKTPGGALYSCQSGTWTSLGGGSTGSGTVNSGTAGQLGYYAATGTAISATGVGLTYSTSSGLVTYNTTIKGAVSSLNPLATFDPTNPDLAQFYLNLSNTANVGDVINPNPVMQWGYNLSPGGGPVVAGQTSWGLGLEGNYCPDANCYNEFHLYFVDRLGVQHRPVSYTVNKADADGSAGSWTQLLHFSTQSWFDGASTTAFGTITKDELIMYPIRTAGVPTDGFSLSGSGSTVNFSSAGSASKGLSFGGWSIIQFPNITFGSSGSITTNGNLTAVGLAGANLSLTDSGTVGMIFNNTAGGTLTGQIQFKSNSSNRWQIVDNGGLQFYDYVGSRFVMKAVSNGVLAFMPDGSGGVSIGDSTDPGSTNLRVVGTVRPAGGYKSADGTTGATVTTCTGFKNGLCISGT